MKKIISTICIAALLSTLTACNNETASGGSLDSGISAPESTNNLSSVPEKSDSTPESSDSDPESTDSTDVSASVPEEEFSEPTLEELIEGFKPDELTFPDGTVIKKTEAVEGMGSADYSILKFDVAVMQYCNPVFQSSYDDPDSFDWENFTFLDPVDEPSGSRVVTVRAGDTLDNGMTVKSAFTFFESSGMGDLYYKLSEIQLDGEQVLEGILYCREEDDYGAYAGDVELYVDTTKCENVPMRYQQYGPSAWTYTFPEYKVALTIDGVYYDFGNIDECEVDLSDVFRDSPFAKVKVTVKDPLLRITESTARRLTAELVDIEVLG